MKYRLAIVFLLLAVLLLTGACGNKGEDSKAYLEILQSDIYTLEAEGSFEGVYSRVVYNTDNTQDKFNIYYRNSNDSTFYFIYTDGVLYRTAQDLKLFAVATDLALPSNITSVIRDYDFHSAVYSKTKKTELYGEEYNYDIYTLNKKNGEETLLYIYTYPADCNLHAFAFPNEGITLNINRFNAGISEDILLDIPEDFTEVDYSQIESLSEI